MASDTDMVTIAVVGEVSLSTGFFSMVLAVDSSFMNCCEKGTWRPSMCWPFSKQRMDSKNVRNIEHVNMLRTWCEPVSDSKNGSLRNKLI